MPSLTQLQELEGLANTLAFRLSLVLIQRQEAEAFSLLEQFFWGMLPDEVW